MTELVKLNRLEQDLVNKQKERDATLVESAGCSCMGDIDTLFLLLAQLPKDVLMSPIAPEQLKELEGHGPQCPYTLGRKIRSQP